jgi:hypothetical protein
MQTFLKSASENFENAISKFGIDAMSNIALNIMSQLANLKYLKRAELYNPEAKSVTILHQRELLAEMLKDNANLRTIKLKLTNETCLFEILLHFAQNKLKLQQITIESMEQASPSAFLVFARQEAAEKMLHEKEIILANHKCAIKRPSHSVQPKLNRSQKVGAIFVRLDDTPDNWITIIMRHDTPNKRHSLCKFSGEFSVLYTEFCDIVGINPSSE